MGNIEAASELTKREGQIRHELDPDSPRYIYNRTIQGKAIFRLEPGYPPAAKSARMSGTVVVQVRIDKAGNVVAAKKLCGPDIFSQASIEAAQKWRFAPTVVDGIAVNVIGTIRFNFKM